jgi:hypothetical protein
MKPRVFVIQDQKVFDQQHGTVSKDYSDAKRFGEITVILENSATPFDLPPLMVRLHEVLKTAKPEDWFIPVGNPVLIGLTIAVAAEYLKGKLRMLQWSGSSRSYIPITVESINAKDQAA